MVEFGKKWNKMGRFEVGAVFKVQGYFGEVRVIVIAIENSGIVLKPDDRREVIEITGLEHFIWDFICGDTEEEMIKRKL